MEVFRVEIRRMQPDKCLFFEENSNCNNVASKEHIIQQGLGGTLSSPDIICGNCNNYFSDCLDIELIRLYEPIMKVLSPLLSGRLKHKKKKAKLTSSAGEECDIEYVGGAANLAKIHKEYSSDGRLESIFAPSSVSRKTLQEIAKAHGVKGETFNEVPLTEQFPDAVEKTPLAITPGVVRAILLDILELADYVSTAQDFPNIARHSSLKDLRFSIRMQPSKQFPPRGITVPFASVSDLLDDLFEPSTFSHRLAISFDYKSKVLILVAQFANTMPWVFVLENIVVNSSSLSVLYKRKL